MVEPMWVQRGRLRYLYLRDPAEMTDATIMVPEPVTPLLAFLDGSRTAPEIRTAMELRVGLSLTDEDVLSILTQLDQALMLENGAYEAAHRAAVRAYRNAQRREMSHAGTVYPESPDDLQRQIDEWCSEVADLNEWGRPEGDLVGMLCPHIDYNRGHASYAEVWTRAASDLEGVEFVVILGTDHFGGPARLTPTVQNYSTPYGTLRTDRDVVEKLASVLGNRAFTEELHHTNEHSIELAAVWLHHFVRERDVSIVPVLCGSFHGFTSGDAHPDEDDRLEAALSVLGEAIESRRSLVIAAGDLAHVGPAFGDAKPLDSTMKSRLTTEDSESLDAIRAGDASKIFKISRAESDRRRICGLPPIYLMLKLLDGSKGVTMAYDQCPADGANASVVSIAGSLHYR